VYRSYGIRQNLGGSDGRLQLAYQEPAFRNKSFLGREAFFDGYTYEKGLSPVAEMVQTQMLQFKTNTLILLKPKHRLRLSESNRLF